MGFDEGGFETFSDPVPGGPNTWDWTFIASNPDYIPTACTVTRRTTFTVPDFITGTVQLDPSNYNPKGGYIMSALTYDKLYLNEYAQLPMNSALTQAEFDSGDFFIWGFPLDDSTCPSAAYPISTYAVSEWVDLKASFTLVGDTLHVSWNPIDIIACYLGPWEIVVTARDSTNICATVVGNDVHYDNMNLGTIVPITQTSIVLQLSSGPLGVPHNITQCAAYAYPLCNKSTPSTFFVQSTPNC